MEELLVITACLYQKGCGDTASTYYDRKPHVREFVLRTEREVKKAAGPIVVEYVTPMALFAAGATGVMRVSRNVDLKYKRDNLEIIFKKEF